MIRPSVIGNALDIGLAANTVLSATLGRAVQPTPTDRVSADPKRFLVSAGTDLRVPPSLPVPLRLDFRLGEDDGGRDCGDLALADTTTHWDLRLQGSARRMASGDYDVFALRGDRPIARMVFRLAYLRPDGSRLLSPSAQRRGTWLAIPLALTMPLTGAALGYLGGTSVSINCGPRPCSPATVAATRAEFQSFNAALLGGMGLAAAIPLYSVFRTHFAVRAQGPVVPDDLPSETAKSLRADVRFSQIEPVNR